MSRPHWSALVVMAALWGCEPTAQTVALVGYDEDLAPPKGPWHEARVSPAQLRFAVHNATPATLALEGKCDGRCSSVRLERRDQAGSWQVRPVTAYLRAQSLPPGSAETLAVLPPTSQAWAPGEYRLTLRLLDFGGTPLDVTREFTLGSWPDSLTMTALRLLEEGEQGPCGNLEGPWSLLFDRTDSSLLIDWLNEKRLRPRAMRHLVRRGGHDAAVIAELERHPEGVLTAARAVDRSEIGNRPLAAVVGARLIERLLGADKSEPDEYYWAARFEQVWPPRTRERFIERLSMAADTELAPMLDDLFSARRRFEGHEPKIRGILSKRCAEASRSLRAVCDGVLPMYGPAPDTSKWKMGMRCGGEVEHSLACEAMQGWDELVARTGQAAVVWGAGRVTRPSVALSNSVH